MKALVIIDVQNDYFPGGRCELVGTDHALKNIKQVLNHFRDKKDLVIHVQHINTRQGAGFFLPDTEGVKIHPDLTPQQGEPVIIKHTPNSFYETELLEVLKRLNVDELVVCGMMTHMCIDTTVRAAKDHAFPVTLIYDACATKDLTIMEHTIPAHTVHDAYMAGLNGMFAQVVLTSQLKS